MVTRSNDCTYRDECLRNGKGTVNIKDLTNREGLYGHGRLFAHITVEPGHSIGLHSHEHETEFFYIIKGEGLFNDDGALVTVKAGDVCATGYGASHSIENVSDAPMEMIALIVME
jgi:mannose-6-phosphate isomerase-like protein (cupin superfamily)